MYIGIDPDLHTCPIAVVNKDGKPVYLDITRIPASLHNQEAVTAMSKALCTAARSLSQWLHDQPYAAEGFVVEAQEVVYTAKTGKNPRDIVLLAGVAGAALAAMSFALGVPGKYVVPVSWKGTRPKQVHQAQICLRLGWEYELRGKKEDGYAVPKEPPKMDGGKINTGDWKHAMDAIGLALWLREEMPMAARIRAAGMKGVAA